MKQLILIKDLGLQYPKKGAFKRAKCSLYRCECGEEFMALDESVKFKTIDRCQNCKDKNKPVSEMSVRRQECKQYKRQGLSSCHETYDIWLDIRRRCNSKTHQSYKNYGAIGIKVCKEWNDDYIQFFEWCVANGWKKGLHINRKNTKGNYTPNNCFLSEKRDMSVSKKKTSKYRGVSFDKASKKFLAQIQVMYQVKRIGSFSTELEAAKAYDKYVIDNNLQHSLNGVL